MYITQMPHFLDETGNIPKQMQKEARELGSFMALVVDTTTISCPFDELMSFRLWNEVNKGEELLEFDF